MASKTGKLLQFINYRCAAGALGTGAAMIGSLAAQAPLQTPHPFTPAAG